MTHVGLASESAGAAACFSCSTQLAPNALSCPLCGTLVHGEVLKSLAAQASESTTRGDFAAARTTWRRALSLLPAASDQYAAIRGRLAELDRLTAEAARRKHGAPTRVAAQDTRPWWKRGATAIATTLVLVLGKLKFLLLGLTKLGTLLSMFAFFGVYWSAYGWPLAAGLVLSIYVHEMGHVAMLKRLGVEAGAPVFIPGIGALVRLKQHIEDPGIDARVGLAGPVWGLGAALAAYAAYRVTGNGVWAAIAHLGGWINLFNLIPVWQLDGARGFHALSRQQQMVVVAAAAVALAISGQGILLLVAGVGVYRLFRPAVAQGDATATTMFVVLIAALSWLATVRAM